MSIDQLKARLADLREQRRILSVAIVDVEQQIAALECPFSVGDVVEFGWTNNRRRAQITFIGCRYGHWTLAAQNVRKDGSLGATVQIDHCHQPVKVSA
jgi:hypothetical protein